VSYCLLFKDNLVTWSAISLWK